MGLFDAIDGSAYETANKRNLSAIATGLNQGGTALQDSARASLGYLFGTPTDPGSFQLTQQGYGQARGDLGNQYQTTQQLLGQATSAYQPIVNAGQAALGSYFDAIGANGQDGSARAAAAFQASPGYAYDMSQALGAVQRSAAARGGLAGGNATADILKTATGLADAGYNNYVNNLKGGVGVYGQGIQGLAGGLTTQGGASQTYGAQLSNLGTGQANALSNIYGQGVGVQTGLGVNSANLISGMTQQMVGANNALAQGKTQASGNALGLLGGLGRSALGSLGGLNPFGSFSSLIPGQGGDLGGDGDPNDWI
jgi:hypothetical protein